MTDYDKADEVYRLKREKVVIYHLLVNGTVDQIMMKALQKKRDYTRRHTRRLEDMRGMTMARIEKTDRLREYKEERDTAAMSLAYRALFILNRKPKAPVSELKEDIDLFSEANRKYQILHAELNPIMDWAVTDDLDYADEDFDKAAKVIKRNG